MSFHAGDAFGRRHAVLKLLHVRDIGNVIKGDIIHFLVLSDQGPTGIFQDVKHPPEGFEVLALKQQEALFLRITRAHC